MPRSPLPSFSNGLAHSNPRGSTAAPAQTEAEGGGTIQLAPCLTPAALSVWRGPGTGDRGPGGCGERKAGWGCPSVAHAQGSCLGSWTQPAGLVVSFFSGAPGAERKDFLFPASWDGCARRIPLFFPSPLSPARRGTHLHGSFSCSFYWEGGLLEGSALPGEEKGPQKVCFPTFASGCWSVRCPRLATGNRRPWISPIGAPRVWWCFSLVLFHLHVSTCNFISIACFPLN